MSTFPDRKPADALDFVLDATTARYGDSTTGVVAMQLEYPGRRRTDEGVGATP